MYILNGIVYAGEPTESLKVAGVKPLQNRMLLITFSTGETRLFDTTILTGKCFEPLNDEDIFNSVYVDYGVVTWKDGEIDCSPEFMYENSYKYSKVV
ncbi:MAG: DUF2442 domain-containing protein [Clostridiales bacterium]|nr:DUF2442 domain-containing protein [Clostridiales bacterium]